MPFQRSITTADPVDVNTSRLWVILRGTESLQTNIGGFVLPPTLASCSQLSNRCCTPLPWTTLMDVNPPSSGMLVAHTLAASSINLAFLEGCYHAYTSHDASCYGITVSTGTED